MCYSDGAEAAPFFRFNFAVHGAVWPHKVQHARQRPCAAQPAMPLYRPCQGMANFAAGTSDAERAAHCASTPLTWVCLFCLAGEMVHRINMCIYGSVCCRIASCPLHRASQLFLELLPARPRLDAACTSACDDGPRTAGNWAEHLQHADLQTSGGHPALAGVHEGPGSLRCCVMWDRGLRREGGPPWTFP